MYNYTIDANVDEPIMLLNKQIGMSYNDDGVWDGEPYINGALFQEELLRLDTLGKKRIQVWINSIGGSVVEAMSIFNAILKSNTPVDTYNVGIAASAAGSIFMAGRRRYMADYAQFMMHPVSGADDKAKEALTNSCIAMLSSKSNITPALTNYMMNCTTWSGASECLTNGICTDIEVTKDANKKYMPTSDARAMLEYSNNILKQTINPIKMDFSKITNKLSLNKEASVEAIEEAVDSLMKAKNEAELDATNATSAKEEAEKKVETLSAQLDAAKEELATAAQATAEALEAQETTEATEAVNKYAARIGNKPETIAKWVNLYKADKEGTTELLEAIPLNRAANKVDITNADTTFIQGRGIYEALNKKN